RRPVALLLPPHPTPIQTSSRENRIMIAALKRASAKRLTAIAPSFPHARQDKKHRGREPISARLVADLYETAGADRMISVDLHAPQVQRYFERPADHLMALPILADHIQAKYRDEDIAVVSPYEGPMPGAD